MSNGAALKNANLLSEGCHHGKPQRDPHAEKTGANTHAQIALSCECGRNTVTRTLQQAQSAGLSWSQARNMTEEEVTAKL